MKLLVILISGIAVCSCSSITKIPKDNSHYVDGVSRYIWMSQGDDVLALVDLNRPFGEVMKTDGDNNEYWLYTRENPEDHQILVNGDESSVTNSYYKKDRPTYFLVHGWVNSGSSPCNEVQKTALLATEDCNVIVVDWRHDAAGLYWEAVSNVPNVGGALGRFLEWLVSTGSADWDNVHLIGFSLGAHVVGNAGRHVGGRPARLTGLDPAGPLWATNDNRLKADDGQYVEVIHTDAGLQGVLEPIGDADFYPNGGVNQPGCPDSGCSHARSYEFFASSIYSRHLIDRECTNLVQALSTRCSGSNLIFGTADIAKLGSGIYGLLTEDSWPF